MPSLYRQLRLEKKLGAHPFISTATDQLIGVSRIVTSLCRWWSGYVDLHQSVSGADPTTGAPSIAK